MGGSASGGSNAQLFDLMAKYGGDETSNGNGNGHKGFKARVTPIIQDWMAGGMHGVPMLEMADSRGMGMGGGVARLKNNTTTPPATTGNPASQFSWQFPQYTQQWAFTPPAAPPYVAPQPFDTSKYGNPLNKKNVKKNT